MIILRRLRALGAVVPAAFLPALLTLTATSFTTTASAAERDTSGVIEEIVNDEIFIKFSLDTSNVEYVIINNIAFMYQTLKLQYRLQNLCTFPFVRNINGVLTI